MNKYTVILHYPNPPEVFHVVSHDHAVAVNLAIRAVTGEDYSCWEDEGRLDQFSSIVFPGFVTPQSDDGHPEPPEVIECEHDWEYVKGAGLHRRCTICDYVC